jgi:hypothetical protein
MTDIETKAPGLFLAGHYRDGVSLSDSIVSGCNVADRIEKYFASATSGQPTAGGTARSADLKSAVSQVCNLPGAKPESAASRLQIGDTADCKSALRFRFA